MADPRFFHRAGPFSLEALASISGAELADPAVGGRTIEDVAPLETAGPNELTFLANLKYVEAFAASRAGAAFAAPRFASRAPSGMALLIAADPYKAFALAAAAFYPTPPIVAGRAPSAMIDPSASVPPECEIGGNVVIAAGARLGRHCQIGANSTIGTNVEMGDDCRIAANVTISHCLMGSRVVVHPGARIGQPGFGFAPDRAGSVTVPQLGRVIIGDDVDIGANTAIDRGSAHDTVIGEGTKIDNLVQIGHNVVLGRGCILAGQVGIAGSTRFGDFVMVGGQVGFTGHLRVGDGARIAAISGVFRDVEPGATVGGIPVVPLTTWMRQIAILQRLARKKDRS
jgi:UDP-3-O-[3-hydroxymyristoyl] glucosamine N-acyltransferase